MFRRMRGVNKHMATGYEWWGYSQEHGWGVRQAGSTGTVRVRDFEFLPTPTNGWLPPFVHFASYIDALSNNERVAAEILLSEARVRWGERIARETEKRELRKQQLAMEARKQLKAALPAARETFFLKLGQPNPGIRSTNSRQFRRTTNCYACKTQLDNSVDQECNECRWIVCYCGACGCGYTG